MFQNYFNVWQRVQVESALINIRFKIFKKVTLENIFIKWFCFNEIYIGGKKKELTYFGTWLYMFIAALYTSIRLYIFYLQDLDDSWDLLEKDVSKLGDGFQDFADKFYVILVSLYVLLGYSVKLWCFNLFIS